MTKTYSKKSNAVRAAKMAPGSTVERDERGLWFVALPTTVNLYMEGIDGPGCDDLSVIDQAFVNQDEAVQEVAFLNSELPANERYVYAAVPVAKGTAIKLIENDDQSPVAVKARNVARIAKQTALAAPIAPVAKAKKATKAAASEGKLPEPPDFSANTHKPYRKKLEALVALVASGDVDGLRAFAINPTSTSPKALARYRDRAIHALTAKAI